MNWLIILYFIELGYSPFYDSWNSLPVDELRISNENVFDVTLDAEVQIFDYFFMGGAIKSYFQDKENQDSFYPFESNYLFKAGLRYKNIELGFRHLCLHPVRPYEMIYNAKGSTNGAYEEFYIRISSKQ